MSALNVVTLAEAKEFIVYDDNDRDNEITTCINTAVNYVETYTNVMLFQRTKDYMLINGCLEIYDSPIDLPLTVKRKQNILSVTLFGNTNEEISASVGYITNTEIPGSLLMAVKKLILYYFENKDVYHADIPWDIQMMCNPFRRSATF